MNMKKHNRHDVEGLVSPICFVEEMFREKANQVVSFHILS